MSEYQVEWGPYWMGLLVSWQKDARWPSYERMLELKEQAIDSWNTQTANQAIGTGALIMLRYVWIVLYVANLWLWDDTSSFRGRQGGMIGFGAL